MIDTNHLATCMGAICDKDLSRNPIVSFDLEQSGITREHLRDTSSKAGWMGPKPFFENAPDRDSPMWKHMVENRDT